MIDVGKSGAAVVWAVELEEAAWVRQQEVVEEVEEGHELVPSSVSRVYSSAR